MGFVYSNIFNLLNKPITLLFKFLRDEMGIINGALVLGLATIVIALIALRGIDETYGRDLNFLEKD